MVSVFTSHDKVGGSSMVRGMPVTQLQKWIPDSSQSLEKEEFG